MILEGQSGFLMLNGPKGEVNSWSLHQFGGRQTVEPMDLGCPLHDQKATVLQNKGYGFFGCFVFKGKFTLCPKTQGPYGSVFL